MRNRTLTAILAMLICLVSAMTVFAAAAAEPAKKAPFNQQAELDKLWLAPHSAVVATVDGADITKGELLRALWYWTAPQMLGELINQKMIIQAAKKEGVTMTEEELKEKRDEAIKRMGVASLEDLLRQFKVTKDRFASSIKTSALAEKTVRKSVKVTDAEYAEYIKARHILIKFPEDETDQEKKEAAAKTKIDEISAKLADGGDFAKLADEYSEDPGNVKDGVKQGGDLGWFTKGRMVSEFESAAFVLPVGKVSEPVKTFYGFHLIRVDAIGKDASPTEKEELKEMILERQVPMEMQKWFGELQSKSKVDNKLQEPAPAQTKPVVRPQQAKPAPTTPPPPPPPPGE